MYRERTIYKNSMAFNKACLRAAQVTNATLPSIVFISVLILI